VLPDKYFAIFQRIALPSCSEVKLGYSPSDAVFTPEDLNLQQCHQAGKNVKNFEMKESWVNWNGYTIRAKLMKVSKMMYDIKLVDI
jgi:hypothetical protein